MTTLLLICLPHLSTAEEFLGAPIIPQGKILRHGKTSMEIKTGLSHDDVLKFYRQALKGEEDIKYRNWKDATYIEDDGKREWHSITISKGEGPATVVITKDSWTWIMGTLFLRYIGVFVVLLILFLGMYVSGSIISGIIKKIEMKKATG